MQNIEDYVDRLIADKGFEEEDEDVMAQLKSDLLTRVEDRVNAMIVTNLDEKDYEAFENVLDTNDQEQIQSFVRAHIPDIDEKVASELLTFKTIYLR